MKKVSNSTEVILKGIKEVIAAEIKSLKEFTGNEFKDVRYELKTLREDMNSRFEKVDTKTDDIVAHSLDMKRTLNSHSEMIGSLAIDLEEVKMGRRVS